MSAIQQFLSDFGISVINLPIIRPMDILDILIVAFIIYQIVLWIKETRAWTLFKGILVVFAFCIIAVVLQLNTILWILSNTLSVGIIAIIVVFQPELRKALEQLGKGHFLSTFLIETYENGEDDGRCSPGVFNQITQAVNKMSENKTGALILIEDSVPLGDIIETGIKIDAVISKELLINIFEHNTPLHDGAVIIRNNKVAAASCFLPLTDADLSKELGTRHRAGVGASEVSDAFIIIVSEETGTISVAKNGKLSRNISTEEINSLYFGESRFSKKIRMPIWRKGGRR